MIPVSKPYVAQKAQQYVAEVIAGDWLSPGGKWARRFRADLADYMGAPAVLANSGTSALEVAIRAVSLITGTQQGTVIIPAATIVDCPVAVVKAGHIPFFVDVDPLRVCLTADELKKVHRSSIVGILNVHMYGMTPDLALYDQARKMGLWVVDDCCEAFGAAPEGVPATTLADAVCVSFRGEKPLPIGTGGAIFARHKGIHGVADSIIGLNAIGAFHRYVSYDAPASYEFPELLSAFGCAQLLEYEEMKDKRWRLLESYRELGIPNSFRAGDAPWKLLVAVDDPHLAWSQMAEWQQVETTPPLLPLQRMAWLKAQRNSLPTPNADHLFQHSLLLPLWPGMTQAEVITVAEAVRPHLRKQEV